MTAHPAPGGVAVALRAALGAGSARYSPAAPSHPVCMTVF